MKKNIIKNIGLLGLLLSFFACTDEMQNVKDAHKVEYVKGSVAIKVNTGFVTKSDDSHFPTAGLKAVFRNFAEEFSREGIVDERGIVTIDSLIPGIYSINIAGKVNDKGQEYYLNGAANNIFFCEDITEEDAIAGDEKVPVINIRPAKVGPLCLKEIYYAGVPPYYFRDQTYEIYNNGDETYYLDSLCFAQLEPMVATATLPVWPDEDGVNNYVYGIVVWQVPGSGKDYPLKPGESFLIVQEALNHKKNNPKSIDNSMAEWEAWSGNPTRDNPEVPNIAYVFWDRPNTFCWITSVMGSAFCIYKMQTPFDPNNWQTQVGGTERFVKIAAGDIMDGVEMLPSMHALDMKRIPGFVDAGGSSVEAAYCGKSICRKVIARRSDGTPIYQDTNNSTNDFEVMDEPQIRRNGEKIPAWSPALNK